MICSMIVNSDWNKKLEMKYEWLTFLLEIVHNCKYDWNMQNKMNLIKLCMVVELWFNVVDYDEINKHDKTKTGTWCEMIYSCDDTCDDNYFQIIYEHEMWCNKYGMIRIEWQWKFFVCIYDTMRWKIWWLKICTNHCFGKHCMIWSGILTFNDFVGAHNHEGEWHAYIYFMGWGNKPTNRPMPVRYCRGPWLEVLSQ